MKKLVLTLAMAFGFLALVAFVAPVYAGDGQGECKRDGKRAELRAKFQERLKAFVAKCKEKGMTDEQIRQIIQAKKAKFMQHRRMLRERVRAYINELKAQGLSKEEIKARVKEKIQEFKANVKERRAERKANRPENK
jgi:DNA-binding transcriptional regulator YhcF (GntR family)